MKIVYFLEVRESNQNLIAYFMDQFYLHQKINSIILIYMIQKFLINKELIKFTEFFVFYELQNEVPK